MIVVSGGNHKGVVPGQVAYVPQPLVPNLIVVILKVISHIPEVEHGIVLRFLPSLFLNPIKGGFRPIEVPGGVHVSH